MKNNNIATIQNEPGFLRMLHAYRQLYAEAKRTMQIRIWVSVALAVFPIAAFLVPAIKDIDWLTVLIAVGIAFIFPSLLKSAEKKKIVQAAAIQEQHDVELFGIEWNESLAGHRVLADEIVAADKRFKGNRKKDWYENIPETLSPEAAALFCQKQNLSWDYKMREDYSRRFVWIFWGVLLIPLAVAAYVEMPIRDYLVKLLMPTVPLLWLCLENYQAHRTRAEKQEIKAQEMEAYLHNNLPITLDMVRKNQDAIYKFRQETMLVPDDYAEDWDKRNRSNNSTN